MKLWLLAVVWLTFILEMLQNCTNFETRLKYIKVLCVSDLQLDICRILISILIVENKTFDSAI